MKTSLLASSLTSAAEPILLSIVDEIVNEVIGSANLQPSVMGVVCDVTTEHIGNEAAVPSSSKEDDKKRKEEKGKKKKEEETQVVNVDFTENSEKNAGLRQNRSSSAYGNNSPVITGQYNKYASVSSQRWSCDAERENQSCQ